ncbi:hypothetical protein GWK47_037394 [Chionoecetes opilio]|uniref:LRRCT domain-containing protein n=1 Tax=Chionoecetes opilio TaxID=41210 RepID=A0A8J4YN45_CHIOP|nr:hypothetical protein GWK47_037394 [Chionoecetes opilio]
MEVVVEEEEEVVEEVVEEVEEESRSSKVPTMALIRASIWGLLCVSCVCCLLFGNVAVDAEEDTQNGEAPDLTKKPLSVHPKLQDGVIYYDIAGVQDAELVISKKNNHSVEGVTASHGECKVRTLRLESRYRLHEDLFTHCSHLHLTLTGKDWQCVKEGRMLKKLGVDVDMSQATCSDAWDDNTTHTVQTTSSRKVAWKYRMEEGIKKLNEFLLELLALDDNQMTDLPRLPEGSFPRLIAIDLPRNRIKKIDLDAFKDLVSREHFIVNLQGNPFQCDCPMYRFKDFLQHNCMANWKIFKSYINIECNNTHANENELIPLHKMAKDTCSATFDWSQVDTWLLLNIFLGVLNLFVIYLMIDLICIITHIGGKTQRRPVMDHVVCAVKSVLCCVCPLRRGNVKVN